MSVNNNDVILKVDHLSMHFGKGPGKKKAVDDVSFDVKRGEVFGLVGESGCGKTTTGRTIIKLYDATSGSVYFKGKRIVAGIDGYNQQIKELNQKLKGASQEEAAQIKEQIASLKKEIASAKYDHKNCDSQWRKEEIARIQAEYTEKIEKAPASEKSALRADMDRKIKSTKKSKLVTQIQMIYQDPVASLDPRMTVKEIVAEGLTIQGIKDQKYIDEKVYEMLETVGLVREHATRYPHEFSGGQRQRIGIARSIIMNPEMIIADEPISALDVSIRAQVINLLNELRERMGLTILFIAHDLSVVKLFSDRIGVMYFGNMVEMASSDELFAHPLHPYTRSLLSAIPQPDPESERNRVRVRYNPLVDHADYEDYKNNASFHEVKPGHFIRCTEKELPAYLAMVQD